MYMETNCDFDLKILRVVKNKGRISAIKMCNELYDCTVEEAENYTDDLIRVKNKIDPKYSSANNNQQITKLDILSQACETGEVLKIKYYAGSNPGTNREICPIEINGNKLTAMCLIADHEKTFFISKIELVEHKGKIELTDNDLIEIAKFKSKFNAIKECKESRGYSLKDSKDYVELLLKDTPETPKNSTAKGCLIISVLIILFIALIMMIF
jgi:ribosomal protein L7/L12